MTLAATQKKVLRVLHVGVANRGAWPLEKCTPETGFVPAALCDVNPAALAKARAVTGLAESDCFTDVDEAIRSSVVDCAIICTPTVLHVPLAKKAIDANLPVLIEKGMAADWGSAVDLVRTAEEGRAVVCVAQNYRYKSMERTIRRAVTDPSFTAHLGEAHLLCYTHQRVRPVPGTLTFPFASVWDMSCHHLDNMMFWLGGIREITAHAWRAGWSAYPHDNNTAAHIVFENGARAHYIHTHDASRSTLDIELHGSKGALFVRGDKTWFNLRPLEQFGKRPIVEVPFEPAQGETELLRDFHKYITEGVEPGISARNNLETMAACEMMVRSITRGQTCRRDELNE